MAADGNQPPGDLAPGFQHIKLDLLSGLVALVFPGYFHDGIGLNQTHGNPRSPAQRSHDGPVSDLTAFHPDELQMLERGDQGPGQHSPPFDGRGFPDARKGPDQRLYQTVKDDPGRDRIAGNTDQGLALGLAEDRRFSRFNSNTVKKQFSQFLDQSL